MAKLALVRVMFGLTTLLGFHVSALYFFLALVIYCTHHREVFGW